MKSLALILFISFSGTSFAALVAYGPSKYLQASDSPWYQGIQNGTIYLEDFRDGLLNTPYVAGTGQIRGPGDKRSVDGDDGVLDGHGQNGGTWGTLLGGSEFGSFEFNFSPNAQGLLPAFVGVVVTRGGSLQFNPEKLGVWTTGAVVPQFLTFDLLPVGLKSGQDFLFDTSEARFIGVYAPEGVERVTLRWADMIDHLQYGYAVPEPSIALLAAGVLAGCLRRRRTD